MFLLTILLSFSCFKDAVTVAFVSSCFTGKEIPDVWHLISPALFVEETLRRAAHLLLLFLDVHVTVSEIYEDLLQKNKQTNQNVSFWG